MIEPTNRKLAVVLLFIKRNFSLAKDKDGELAMVDSIRRNVEFKGTNLWVLIFAIFIASLGLNVNSAAVIIGAMLISPLMGPIMGIGLGLGINDFELIKKAGKNLFFATIIAMITSTLYFLITPLSEARSELLARTTPTTYDVLIAFFGGMAGIIAAGSKEKGNVIPGVAIATALMPPLCTAGFGLATGNMTYFLGALYLYFINSVFISVATIIGVRIFKVPKKVFLDPLREKRVSRSVAIIVFVTLVPSVITAISVVRTSFFEASANRFLAGEFQFRNTEVINKEFTFDSEEPTIELFLIGDRISDQKIDSARARLVEYSLKGTKLIVKQGIGPDQTDVKALKTMLLEDFYKNSEQRIVEQQRRITALEQQLGEYAALSNLNVDLAPEVRSLFPSVATLSLAQTIQVSVDPQKIDTIFLAIVTTPKDLSIRDKVRLEEWMQARTKRKQIKMIYQK